MRLRWRMTVFLCFALAVVGYVFSRPRVPQDPAYHLFADGRSMFGIPNFFDVVSNLPFLVAGIWGLIRLMPRGQIQGFREERERWPYVVFCLSMAMTCCGSAYYHWSPGSGTLLWDRLPMAVGFMGILAATVGDRIGARAGRLCLVPMLVIGIFSVLYWHFGELNGSGDLRLYIVVQYFTLAAVLLLVLLFPARYTHGGWLIAAGGLYVLAKVFEVLDRPIFDIAGVSGHTFKHLTASLAAFCIVGMIRRRTTVEASQATAGA